MYKVQGFEFTPSEPDSINYCATQPLDNCFQSCHMMFWDTPTRTAGNFDPPWLPWSVQLCDHVLLLW